jgi:GNAT superfamily N-acetyltransferase
MIYDYVKKNASLGKVTLEDLTVRSAVLADAEIVFVMLGLFATSYSPDHSVFTANYPRIIENVGSDLLVAEVDGIVVGYVLAADSLTLFANGIVTELLELYVVVEHRGQGIGRALVENAVSNAKARGSVEVTVPTRRAGDFYIALGFESTAEFFKLKLGRS